MRKIYVEGHRGACGLYPENTLLSYRKAMEMGVDAIEFDIWLTSDKVPVLMHDGVAFWDALQQADAEFVAWSRDMALPVCGGMQM